MKIARIRITDVLGIDELELTPGGTLTEISGGNGKKKTSILEAIKAATQGGHDATLLRKGAEKGEVVLVLDSGAELRKRITATKSTLELYQDGKKVPGAATTIKGLTDLLSVNPIEFLTAQKKDRVRVLLEAMPITVDTAKVSKITGVEITESEAGDGLALLDRVRKEVFDDRTGTNRAIAEKEGTINQLKLAMPDLPEGVSGNEDEMAAQVDAARAARDAENQRIDTKLTGIRKDSAAAEAALRASAQTRIDEIKAKAQADIDAVRAQAQQDIDAEAAKLKKIEGLAELQREKAATVYATTTEPLDKALITLRANRSAAAKREQTMNHIRVMESELQRLQEDAQHQSGVIKRLDEYKTELLDNLPIPGLEVVDGEVLRNGVHLDRLNTAQQVEIAIEIAKLRAGDLKVCCVDRFECLDPDTLAEFKARAEESGLQLFVTRVTQGELNIATS